MKIALVTLSGLLLISAKATQEALFFGEARSLTDKTITFAPNYDQESENVSRGAVVGMVVGFFALTTFILFSVISLVYDDV